MKIQSFLSKSTLIWSPPKISIFILCLCLNKENAIICNLPGLRMRAKQQAGGLFCQLKRGWKMLKERGRWCALLRRRRQRKRWDFSNLLIFFQIILFQCPICNKYPKKGEGLYKHVRSHKMAAPLECTYPGCNAVRGHIILWIQFNMDFFRRQHPRMQCDYTFTATTKKTARRQLAYKAISLSYRY